MHVGIFADLEGAFGIWRMRQCRTGTAEWQYGRQCLTADVNQVIAGAFDGGARKVTVKDTHDTGFNCLINRLDRRAQYIGGHYARPTFFGNLSDYDLILYVAIHAASGTPDAFFPHTHYGIFSEVRINRKPVCEMDLHGAYLGEFGVPIGLVAGEDIAVKQALTALPWAESVVVDKNKKTYTSGSESAETAVRGVENMKPLKLAGPLYFEAEFRSEDLMDKFNTWNFQKNGKVVSWKADNILDGFDNLNKLVFFPRKVYPFRGIMLMLFRSYYRIKHTYFAPAPNAEGAITMD
ncbi:MAG: M55 family metallopeptidase [Deltaproteobacteria bacterium]|nr:M55 family metallopeptidase [Deltaproteobacteria bacterium]